MSDILNEVKLEDTFNFADTVNYEVVEDPARIREVVDLLLKEKVLAVDTENSGIDPHKGWPILLQIGTSDKCYIFELWKKEIDFSAVKDVLEHEGIVKVFFNAKYDWKWIFHHTGIRVKNIFCSQVAERLLTVGLPNAKIGVKLSDVVLKYLGITLRKEVRSGFINRKPWLDPITKEELAYSAGDVVLLPDVYYQQFLKGRSLGLLDTFNLENRTLPALAEAETEGVNIHREKWREHVKEAQRQHSLISNKIFQEFDGVIAQKTLFGVPTFNIGSGQQLLDKLKKLGFDLPDTEESTVKKYKNKHPVFPLILTWKSYNTVLAKYGDKFIDMLTDEDKLHCQFNQVRAETGRMSAEKPNVQQIPGFDPEDPTSLDFRSCFVTEPGYKLITADFSQQELRILADMSGDPTFYKAYTELDENGKALDVHRYTASVVFEVPYKEVTDNQRKKAKTLNFFLVFGGGAYSLAETLKCTEEEAQDVIDSYFRRYGKIKQFLDTSANAAVSNGYSQTISGRKRFLTLPDPGDPMFFRAKNSVKRKGKNTPIQGSGADVTKMALVFLYERLLREGWDAKILMVVHDEFVVKARADQAERVARIVEEEMVRGYSHFFKRIPMVVDAHIGDTWEK